MDDAGIYARKSEYLGRYVQLGVASDRVLSVSFPESPDTDDDDHPLLDRIEAYLEGEPDSFTDVSIALTVPTDQRKVLEAAREIPYGEDVTVERLARMTPGLDASSRESQDAVRDALAANPAPLLIPDHRVRDGASSTPATVEQRLRSLENL
jgi:methylated-DNA-[protein]-cysteine S-methyltransferase